MDYKIKQMFYAFLVGKHSNRMFYIYQRLFKNVGKLYVLGFDILKCKFLSFPKSIYDQDYSI